MVGIFRQKNSGNSLILLVYALVLKFGILLRPSPPLRQEEDHYLYVLLVRLLNYLHLPTFVFNILGFLIICVQASLLNRITIDQKMLPRPNYLPGMAYILCSSLFIEWNYFSAPMLANTLLILIFYRMINLYNTPKPLAGIFNIGVMTGIVTLLYQPAVFYVLMMPFTLFIMRPFRIREWLTGFLGLTIPYYFLALEPLFTNQWNWKYLVPSIVIDFPAMPNSIFITISIILLVVPFIIGGYFVQANLNKMLIQIRKAWSLLLLFLIMSVFIILVNGGVNYVNWSFGLLPLAAFHGAAYYYPEKRRWFPLILHWITFGYALYMCYWMLGGKNFLTLHKFEFMKFGIVVFPGSNCDRDMQEALQSDLNQEAVMLWHKDKDISMFSTDDCIVLPGGFSFGDYLRCGAIARFSPMMQSVINFANKGGKVLGVCNGFQILCEAHLLPGVLMRNINQQFLCKNVYLKGEGSDKPLMIPIAHGEGRFFAGDKVLDELESNNQVIYRYCDEKGNITPASNHNGASRNIAGIRNKDGNVFGMMPHPERACSAELGNTDGRVIIESLLLAKARQTQTVEAV